MNRIVRVNAVCLITMVFMGKGAIAAENPPDPGFLEFLGKALELEEMGINVDQLIEQRLLVQEQNKKAADKAEVTKP